MYIINISVRSDWFLEIRIGTHGKITRHVVADILVLDEQLISHELPRAITRLVKQQRCPIGSAAIALKISAGRFRDAMQLCVGDGVMSGQIMRCRLPRALLAPPGHPGEAESPFPPGRCCVYQTI